MIGTEYENNLFSAENDVLFNIDSRLTKRVSIHLPGTESPFPGHGLNTLSKNTGMLVDQLTMAGTNALFLPNLFECDFCTWHQFTVSESIQGNQADSLKKNLFSWRLFKPLDITENNTVVPGGIAALFSNVVPGPTTMLLLGTGLVGLAGFRRRYNG